MTAEAAVLNKGAVALAADSAATSKTEHGHKIYDTVNKLFMLSKRHPVGIMVYGNAELMGMPWETIIKIYRDNLKERDFPTLRDYVKNFLSFLSNNRDCFPKNLQSEYFAGLVHSFFSFIKQGIDEQIKSRIDLDGKINDQQIEVIVGSEIDNHYNSLSEQERLKCFTKEYAESLHEKYESKISEVMTGVFEKHKISEKSKTQLKKIACLLFTKESATPFTSGIVIAGFGRDEQFPSVVTNEIYAILDNKLCHVELERDGAVISHDNSASLIAFADKEMVYSFMQGISPSYKAVLQGYLDELFDVYPERIASLAGDLGEDEKKDLVGDLQKIGHQLKDEFIDGVLQYERESNINPVLDAIERLPKDELAAMAETLVNLTKFKRKVSIDALETVGGEIDVAVISKGDGFIWIQRKHYFEPALNPYYLSKI